MVRADGGSRRRPPSRWIRPAPSTSRAPGGATAAASSTTSPRSTASRQGARGSRLRPRRASSTARRWSTRRSAPAARAATCSSPPSTAIAGWGCSTASRRGALGGVGPRGGPRLVVEGPMARALAAGPAGLLFGAAGQGGEIFAPPADGGRPSLARFTAGDAPGGLAFVPATAETRAAGLAGDLLVAVIRSGAFQLNEIVRIAGPFADLTARPAAPPTH